MKHKRDNNIPSLPPPSPPRKGMKPDEGRGGDRREGEEKLKLYDRKSRVDSSSSSSSLPGDRGSRITDRHDIAIITLKSISRSKTVDRRVITLRRARALAILYKYIAKREWKEVVGEEGGGLNR